MRQYLAPYISDNMLYVVIMGMPVSVDNTYDLGQAVMAVSAEVQHDKISHIDIQDDHIDIPYPISISRMTISIWWMTTSMYHLPYRYRYPTSISRSYLVTLPKYFVSLSL